MLEVSSYGYTVGYACAACVVDLVVFMVAALYLDNVMPTPGGMRKPWLYFLDYEYWCPRGPVVRHEETEEMMVDEEFRELCKNYELVEPELRSQESQGRTVKIRNLRKLFDDKPAVDGLNVDMYSGQIFALLGHNGAGKTTTISMLTGMLLPTEGSATAFGVDLLRDFLKLRKNLGVCAQHNSYFEQLTVAEHLSFFGRIKGLSAEQVAAESQRLLADVGLSREAETQGRELSGGNLRKLAVALAFLGAPKLVVLDEPTSGMDATTRRELWEVLEKYKRDRIIILTTHYMDEADALGDRIGIMTNGKLVCCGSSMFLKKKYGIGYNLVVIMQDQITSLEKIKRFVVERIDGAEVSLTAGEEVEFRLPFSASPKFKAMFNEMDSSTSELGVKSYGVSVTTLEDVFIRVGESGAERRDKVVEVEGSVCFLTEELSRSKCSQLCALLKKKLKENVRNWSAIMMSIVLPLVLLWAGLFALTTFLTTGEHTYSISKDFGKTPLFVNAVPYINSGNESSHLDWLRKYKQNSSFTLIPVHVNHSEHTPDVISSYSSLINQSSKSLDPYVYGSYYIYQYSAWNHTYAAIMLFNLTTPQSLLAFGGEFMNMLVKSIRGNKCKVETTLAQMQVSDVVKDIVYRTQEVSQFTSLLALGLGLIPGVIGSYLVHEYEHELKAHLLLAGLPLGIYWLAYFVIDLLSFYIPIGGVVAIYKGMDLSVLLL